MCYYYCNDGHVVITISTYMTEDHMYFRGVITV